MMASIIGTGAIVLMLLLAGIVPFLLVVAFVLLAMSGISIGRRVLSPRRARELAMHPRAVTRASPRWATMEPSWTMRIGSIVLCPRWTAAGHTRIVVSQRRAAGAGMSAEALWAVGCS
jgi:uncharacterized membrane protein